MADSKSPKYKSIDDILDALKDRSSGASEDEVDGEDESPVTPIDEVDVDVEIKQTTSASGGVKTAKQLRDELSADSDEIDPLDDETEDPADPKDEELDAIEKAESDEADPETDAEPTDDDPADDESVEDKPAPAMPHASGPFKSHINAEDSETDSGDETPPQHSSVFAPIDPAEEFTTEKPAHRPEAVKFNLGPTPSSDRLDAGDTAMETPAYERSLDDLATESESPREQHIPRITPHASVNSEMGQHFAPPPTTAVNSHSFDYEMNKPAGGRGSKFHLVILAIVGLIVIAGSVYFLKYQFKGGATPAPSATPSPTEQPTPTPTPTPTPIARGDYKIKVLNGTSQAGLAASVAAQLKSLGYQISGTGNATNSAFTQTVARTKADNTPLFDQLVRDLAGTYTITAGPTLKSSDTQDAELILGTN